MESDKIYPTILTIYLGSLLFFSSFFYLATEDYEYVVAVRLIAKGVPIGKSTGWPYMPLAAYLFYVESLLFGANILAFRILTAVLLTVSVFPIYLTLRTLCTPFVAFALTLFSFSLITFPHPRLEYYVEGAVLTFSIFFAVKLIDSNSRKHLYLSALFLFAGFGSRGYPNSALLVLLLPTSLLLVHGVNRDESKTREVAARSSFAVSWLWLFLVAPCFGFLISFLRKAVYQISKYEYASLSGFDPRDFHDRKMPLGFLVFCLLLISCAPFFLRRNFPNANRVLRERNRQGNQYLNRVQLVSPFVLVAICFISFLYLIGQPLENIYFFFLPIDVIIDHLHQLETGRSYIIPLWLALCVAFGFMTYRKWVEPRQQKKALFLFLLLPFAFTRSFPSFNMLYFISFVLAIFVAILIPITTRLLLNNHELLTARLQYSCALFLLLFAVGSNVFLLVETQLKDFRTGRLATISANPVRGIWIEKDIAAFFTQVDRSLTSVRAPKEKVAFFSNRYLNYIPLIYGYNDVLAGQNLTTGLGKTWSYDDVFRIEAQTGVSVPAGTRVIYAWRNAAVTKLESAGADVIVMSLYDGEVTAKPIEPSSDPFREYLRTNFVMSAVIRPAMKIHRRSRFSEGAVIFTRKSVHAASGTACTVSGANCTL